MGENQERRQGRRQTRGLHRVDDILHAAGGLFAEVGYDKATTNMIAARAGISPGSLYQYFPHKEAIAQAFAADTTAHLHQVYDSLLAPDVIGLPLSDFLDTFVEALVTFNTTYPGYLALSIGSTISASLALALADLRKSTAARLDAVIAARWPNSTPEQRQLPIRISFGIFLALLPMVLDSTGEQQQAIVREMKAVLYRYWQPIFT